VYNADSYNWHTDAALSTTFNPASARAGIWVSHWGGGHINAMWVTYPRCVTNV